MSVSSWIDENKRGGRCPFLDNVALSIGITSLPSLPVAEILAPSVTRNWSLAGIAWVPSGCMLHS